jgi:hypothetical protein
MHSARRGDEGADGTTGRLPRRGKDPLVKTCFKCRRTPDDGTKLSVCSVCMTTHYCPGACQRADWKEHKLEKKKHES